MEDGVIAGSNSSLLWPSASPPSSDSHQHCHPHSYLDPNLHRRCRHDQLQHQQPQQQQGVVRSDVCTASAPMRFSSNCYSARGQKDHPLHSQSQQGCQINGSRSTQQGHPLHSQSQQVCQLYGSHSAQQGHQPRDQSQQECQINDSHGAQLQQHQQKQGQMSPTAPACHEHRGGPSPNSSQQDLGQGQAPRSGHQGNKACAAGVAAADPAVAHIIQQCKREVFGNLDEVAGLRWVLRRLGQHHVERVYKIKCGFKYKISSCTILDSYVLPKVGAA